MTEEIERKIITVWKNCIGKKFQTGLLVYERQLQADLYLNLTKALGNKFHIWIEPVIY